MGLKEDSKKIDKEIEKRFWKKGIITILFVIYFGGAIVATKVAPQKSILGGFIIWLLLIFIGLGGLLILKKKIGSREQISCSLYKIAEGIEKGKLNKKYLVFLEEGLEYWEGEEEEIEKKDPIFKQEKLKEFLLKKNLLELIGKINYALNNNELDKINKEDIEKLARDIYHQNRGFVEFSMKINKKLDLEKKEILSGTSLIFESLFKTNLGKFIVGEFVLAILAILSYFYITSNKDTILIVFGTITGALMLIIFTKDRKK